MKKLIYITALIWGILASCKTSVKVSNVPDMVKARLHSIFYWQDSIKDVSDYYNDVWVKDSFLIFKRNQVRLLDKADTGRKRATLVTMNYSFINLRNYHCQDYIEFNDKATPVSNYVVGINDTIHNYMLGLNRYPVPDNKMVKFTRISDTVENGIKYKRYQAFKTYADSFEVKTVAFTGSENYPPYFHAGNKSTNIKFRKDEVIVKICDFHKDSLLSVSQTENLTSQLTQYDEKVFAKWKENSEHTQLPLISATEASKILGDTLFQIDLKRFNYFRPAK